MKKIVISLMAGMVLLTGCDLLNNDPDTDFTKDTYFTSETNVELYCNYFYNEFSGYGNNGTYGVFYFPKLNDNQAEKGLTTWSYINIPATNSTWKDSYEEIRRVNTLIEKLPNVDMAEANRNHWMGLARLYRGYQHYKLVRSFGDCYWVDRVLEEKDQASIGARQNRDEVMDNILADLNFAVANMSLNSGSRTAYNVYVANAIKAEICLYEGTFCKYRTVDENGKAADATRANKYLAEAKKACEVIMNSGKFSLTNGVEGYRANYNSLDLAGNNEMIMYKKYVRGVLAHATQDYCCGSTPTKGMSKAAFDAYLKLDGTVADRNDDHGTVRIDTHTYKIDVKGADGKVLKDDAGNNIQKDTTVYDTVYTIEAVLAQRDPRLAQQVDEDLRYVGKGRIRYRWEGHMSAAENTSYTGYGILKFDEPKTSSANRQSTVGNETDAPIFWLAEIYLDYAEACAEMGNMTQDDLDKSINMLRKRVGMPDLALAPAADPANNMGVSDLIWEIRRERRVEMMYDKDDRYWCLIRWHQLDKLDTQKYPDQTLGAWLDDAWVRDSKNVTVTAAGYIDCKGTSPDRIFDKKYYLNPIPSGQISLNAEIGQNLGWE